MIGTMAWAFYSSWTACAFQLTYKACHAIHWDFLIKMTVVMWLTILVMSTLPVVPFISGPDIARPSLNVSEVSDLDPIILLRLASVTRLPSFLPSAHCWEVPAGRNLYWRQRQSHLAVLMMVLSLSVNLELNPGLPCGAQGNGPNIDALGLGEVSKKGCMFLGHLNVRSLSQCVDELRDLGDLTINLMSSTPNSRFLESLCKELSLTQMITGPTRVTQSNATLIDHIMCQILTRIVNLVVWMSVLVTT